MILFLDIETMGQTADNYQTTAIGYKIVEEDTGRAIKTEVLFVDKPSDEERMLREFYVLTLSKVNKIIVWRTMDVPFLQTRALVFDIDFDIVDIPVIDLHPIICKLVFSQKRFKDIGMFLGFKRKDDECFDGAQMPQFYQEFREGKLSRKDDIILHCENDVNSLWKLFGRLKRVGLVE